MYAHTCAYARSSSNTWPSRSPLAFPLSIRYRTPAAAHEPRDLGATLDLATRAVPPDAGRLHRRLADRVQRLSKHVGALHEVHQPWGLTPFGVQAALLGISQAARTPARLPAPERLDAEAAEVVRDEIREFAHLGGFTLRPYSTPWYGALIRTAADAHQARELAATLDSETLPMFAHKVEAARAGLRRREDFAAQVGLVRLFAGIEQTLRTFDPAVYASSPALLAAATGDGEGLGLLERRRLRAQARSLRTGQKPSGQQPAEQKPSWQDMHGALAAAASQLAQWQELSEAEPGPPWLPSGYQQLTRLFAEAERQLAALRALVPALPEPSGAENGERPVERMVRALAADQDTPWKLPRLYELALRFDRMGMRPLLDELARREADGDLAAAAFDHAWYSSILDEIRVRDPRYAAERGGALDEIADDFRHRDVEHLAANRSRVRQTWAETTRDAEDRHPLQARLRVGARRAAAAAADRAAELALPQPGRTAGGLLQRAHLRRRADHLPRRAPRRLPAARRGEAGRPPRPGGLGRRRGGQGGGAGPRARQDQAAGIAGRDRARRQARRADRPGAALGAGIGRA
jgi:hypothetical protein